MKDEIEAKFLNVNIDDIRRKLKAIGAKLEFPMRDMKRVTIETQDMTEKGAFIRIRDEGDKTTITYKQFNALTVDGVKEVEIIVNDFDTAVELFEQAGLTYGSLQESRRESWRLGSVEIVIDEWPWLHPYAQIEGIDELSVRSVAGKLGFDWEDALFGDVMVAYRAQYPYLTINDMVSNITNVRFSDPLPPELQPK